MLTISFSFCTIYSVEIHNEPTHILDFQKILPLDFIFQEPQIYNIQNSEILNNFNYRIYHTQILTLNSLITTPHFSQEVPF